MDRPPIRLPAVYDPDRNRTSRMGGTADSSESTDSRLRELELLSRWLDNAFEIPFLRWRFGLDPILGLFPGIGDTITALASLYILATATRLGAPRIALARMSVNIALDFILGSIPLIGDLFDVWWKSNQMNVQL